MTAVARPTRKQRTRALSLAEIHDKYRRRAQACRASGESPYDVLEAAIREAWSAGHDQGQLDALMAIQKDPRIAEILLAPTEPEPPRPAPDRSWIDMQDIRDSEPRPSSHLSIKMTNVESSRGVLPAIIAVVAVAMLISWLVVR